MIFFIIAGLFAASLIAWHIISMSVTANPYAEIYKNGVLIKTVALSETDSEYQFTVGTPEEGFNVILVKHGEIGVIEADCPDGICIKTGFIANGVIPVICLPNKLEIRVVSGNSETDAVAR